MKKAAPKGVAVKGYTRHLKNGKTVAVKGYTRKAPGKKAVKSVKVKKTATSKTTAVKK